MKEKKEKKRKKGRKEERRGEMRRQKGMKMDGKRRDGKHMTFASEVIEAVRHVTEDAYVLTLSKTLPLGMARRRCCQRDT